MTEFLLRTGAGEEYVLDDALNGIDGLGMPPIEQATQSGPYQHGASLLQARLRPRTVTIALELLVADYASLWSERARLAALFSSLNVPLQLCATLPDGSQRQLDLYFAGELTLARDSQSGPLAQPAVAQLLALDPTWYDPEAVALTWGLGGGAGGGVVPMPVPMAVGASTIDQTLAVAYAGTWLSYPHLVRITGPITDPVITNQTTDEVLDFTGLSIAAGHWYDLDLRYGRKTVRDDGGVNRIAQLSADSDLATWHLAAAPEAGGGINSLRCTGSNANDATKIDITYFTRYLGI